jgi:diacylglycerol kinase (ATP)
MFDKMFDNKNKPTGINRIMRASEHSIRAFNWLIKNETAIKQELMVIVILIPLSFIFDITALEQVCLILSLLFVLFSEMLNTAIEVIVDRIGLEINPLSGLAKDIGSAIVMLSLGMTVLVWACILWP